MKKRVLSILLCIVMLVSLLPVTAGATGICDHSDWTAVTMGETHIKLGTTEQNSNTLPEGSYYLDSEITVPLTISGSVNLCLNGKSITVSDDFAIKINSDASLTLSDCGTGGKVTNSGSSSYSYGIYNSGTFILNSGTVEATGSSGRGVYNASSRTVYIAGGVITGTQHGIYNYSSSNKVYLSGEPAISGTTADIYTDSSYSYIYANDGADTPTAYNGNEITLAYWYLDNDYTLVRNVTAANKNKFTLTDTNYQLGFDEEDGILTTQGKPQTLIWYAADGESVLTGDGYPSTWPYGEYLYTSDLPVGSVVAEKAFLGWLYRDSGNSTWSTSCWSSDLIESAKEFKAEYVDSFAGSGTKDDPYQISTASDLQKMATVVNSGNTAYNNSNIHYKLMGSIDLSSVCGSGIGSWTPIGDYDNTYVKFSANFDGNNQTISNLYINTSDSYQGLFGYVYGNYSSNVSIKNLNLDNVSVSSSGSKVGAVAGYADYAKITGCSVTGSVSGDDDCGALVGYPYDCTLEYNNTSGVAVSPHGYTVDENGVMAHKTRYSNAIDIKGNYKENWIQTTYGDYGYEVTSSGLNGAEVTSAAEFINDGKYIQLNYTVEAGSSAISGGKLAVHADVQIGDNDSAAMEVIQDASGKVIGLKMVDTHTGSCTSKDAQFNLYFDGTGGVTPVSTYWFGYYISRSSHYYDNLTQSTLASGSNGEYTLEDGVYTKLSGTDSGFAISWQDISLEANESKTFSFVLGVGEKADPPEWGSNGVYLTLNAQQTGKIIDVSAKVRDAAGLTDTLYYSVDGDDGIDLGDVSADGTVKTLAGQLDLAIYEPGTYSFSFWVVNSKGAASASVVREITINGDGSITGLDTEVPVTHTVTFDAQSGSAVDAITVDNGGTIATLPESTRNGFTFCGWYTEPGGVGALLTNETTITANITYYAKWTENTPAPVTYTVTVQNDGNGTATASPASAEAGTQITLTAVPASGYHFKEWQVVSGTISVSNNKFTMPASNVTVKAIFEADAPGTYTVTYLPGANGTGNEVSDTKSAGTPLTLKGAIFTRTGYTQTGWATSDGGAKVYELNGAYSSDTAVTLYPVWTANTYTVTLNTGGATINSNNVTSYTYGIGATLPTAGDMTKESHQFDGWYENSNFTGSPVTTISATATGDKTYYAKWTQVHTITGTVKDNSGNGIGGVAVKLMQGSDQFGETQTTVDGGQFSFTSVPRGSYNVVAVQSEKTKTELVIIEYENAMLTIMMPEKNVSSTLNISGGSTPDVVVGGLDDEASVPTHAGIAGATTHVSIGMTVEAKEDVTGGGSSEEATQQTAIKQTASAQQLDQVEFLSITVTKTVTTDGTPDGGTALEQTQTVLELIIPYSLAGKYNIGVYRHHDGRAEAFAALGSKPNEQAKQDKTFWIDTSNELIHIYTNRFSNYAIAYSDAPVVTPTPDPTPSGGDSYTPTYAITVEKADNGDAKTNCSYASSGSTVTITATPKDGYVVDAVTVTDSQGISIEVTRKSDGTYTFKMPGRKVTVEAVFVPDNSFAACTGDNSCPMYGYTDLDTKAWYHDGVHYCIDNGLMSGYGNGIFKPDADTTRAMIIVMLWRLNGSPVVNYLLDFEDVAEGQWYTEAIRWAKSEGIAVGYGNGYFGTNDAITREQMVTILWCYAQHKDIDVSVGEDTNILSYNDAFDVAEYAIPAMQWACGSGMVQGMNAPDGEGMILAPESKGTRAQIATMLMCFCTEIVK